MTTSSDLTGKVAIITGASKGIGKATALRLAQGGAVEQMVRVLCKDLATKQITVNAVAPGPTDTPLFNKGMSEPGLTFVKNLIPRGRLGAPHEIAEVMAFFASDASGWVSGQVLRVNGGMA